ncbi:TPA: molecular chaperone [Escherichia coli]|nr:fimbria/pilus periplasmic chaperone [Escherichia coli]EFL4055998.1 molecular chaperone [Escherichia coli]EFN4330279.1 molecular chaperone [Escherichia coli]EGO4295002.1 molecular chaperone [Escherichia coli]EHR8527490.1 molecular chaperone [Escherichia coli]
MKIFAKTIAIALYFQVVYGHASVFGPNESKIIFKENEGMAFYSIENTDPQKAWLVQAWIEDSNEKKTSDFITLPQAIRVEPKSKPSIRIIKKTPPPSDRESLYWIVSHSIPAGLGKKDQHTENEARLTLAYRFKVPMFYRPEMLSEKPNPEKIKWSISSNGYVSVNNPTKYAVQLHHVVVNGKKYQGNGVSYIILPMTSTALKFKANIGDKIKFSIVNDFGAIKDYDATINEKD